MAPVHTVDSYGWRPWCSSHRAVDRLLLRGRLYRGRHRLERPARGRKLLGDDPHRQTRGLGLTGASGVQLDLGPKSPGAPARQSLGPDPLEAPAPWGTLTWIPTSPNRGSSGPGQGGVSPLSATFMEATDPDSLISGLGTVTERRWL